jgi:hypothetical protein
MLDHPSVGDLYRKESVFFFKKEKIKKNKLSMETRFHLLEKCKRKINNEKNLRGLGVFQCGF